MSSMALGKKIMELKVSTRISAGFAAVLFLSVAIAFVGYQGTEKVHKNLNGMMKEALPLIHSAVQLESSLLKAQTLLGSYHEQNKLSALAAIEEQYKLLKAENERAHKELLALAKTDGELLAVLAELDKSRKQLLDAGDALMVTHREALKKHQIVSEKTRLIKDMGDEMVGVSSDLKSTSAVRLANMIDDAILLTVSGIELKVKGGVLNKKKNVQNDLANIEKLLLQMSTKNLSGSTKFIHIKESFQRLKEAAIGTDGVFDSRTSEIDLLKNDQESLDAAIVAGGVLSKNMDAFNAVINKRTEALDANAEKTVKNSKSMIVIFSVLAIAGALLLAIYIVQSIKKPLKKIVDGVQQLASGDLRTEFKVDGNDEFSQLSDHMQKLAENMRNIVGEINSGCLQLAATAEQTATISDLSFKNINEQKEQTTMIATATEELMATVEEVAKSINSTLSEIENACQQVSDGETSLGENVTLIRALSNDVEHATSVIKRLAEDTTNIGSILDVITGVAEQTNLLALNAAIEAARAGEQGRGFAVVADEVRTLAARAQQSTSEIKDMIQRLQNGAVEAVKAMDKSRQGAHVSANTITEASDRLNKIVVAMNNIRDMSLQISSASEEQTAVTSDQLNRITAIANASERNADSARESNSASQDLARMAEAQRALVSVFKI